MCVMMTEIQTLEGGQKRSLLTTGDQIYLKKVTPYFLFIRNPECRTNGGPKYNAKCIFPFKYKGETYNGCPPDLTDKTKTW